MGSPLPGFDEPAASFDQPFAMLAACHQRVQRTLGLLGRLVEHVQVNGHDVQSRTAATDVLRYFDLAAPLHHADEEVHVFPLLLAQGGAAHRTAVLRLQDDHRRMETLWSRLRTPLQRWSEPACTEVVDAALLSDVAAFRALYDGHIATEEGLAFPAAQALMDAPALAGMGRQMQARRQT